MNFIFSKVVWSLTLILLFANIINSCAYSAREDVAARFQDVVKQQNDFNQKIWAAVLPFCQSSISNLTCNSQQISTSEDVSKSIYQTNDKPQSVSYQSAAGFRCLVQGSRIYEVGDYFHGDQILHLDQYKFITTKGVYYYDNL